MKKLNLIENQIASLGSDLDDLKNSAKRKIQQDEDETSATRSLGISKKKTRYEKKAPRKAAQKVLDLNLDDSDDVPPTPEEDLNLFTQK